MINLNDYFNRIGFTGEPRADLNTLKQLQVLHPAMLAFENIDVLLNRGIDLDPEAIQEKLLHRGRGGYCFEHNNLLMWVLQAIGYEVEPLMARAVWRLPEEAPAGPRTHMVLKVTVEGETWLADVGFGGIVLNAPIQLVVDRVQDTPLEQFRLIEQPYGYRLEVRLAEQWNPVYELGNDIQKTIDLEVANWYTSAHPTSKFRHNLMAARATEDTRYTLLNNRLSIRKQGNDTVQITLNATELVDALAEHFLLSVEDEWHGFFQNFISAKN